MKSWAVKPGAHWPMLPYSLAPGKSHEQRRSNPTDRDTNIQSFSSYLLLFPPSPPSCHSGWSSASQLPWVPPCSRIYGFPLPHRMLLSFFLTSSSCHYLRGIYLRVINLPGLRYPPSFHSSLPSTSFHPVTTSLLPGPPMVQTVGPNA